ncbi:2128_t:CDS:10 [Paraglomus occultum]|uniref:2128_t:CDS:1 n=1 Tax=Paraglomus occultum TaxID=144539 RepID=A0A9N8WR04_9GLOM|nr:2128_t:CDS:10 [Paraglomus occultum]
MTEADLPTKKLRLDSGESVSTSVVMESASESRGKQMWTIEEDVGITEYISQSLPGFSAVIKQRYADFIVHEIDQQGDVVYLTDYTSIPKRDDQSTMNNTSASPTESSIPEDAIYEQLKALTDEETAVNIKELFSSRGEKDNVVTKSIDDKNKRTAIHMFIREHFGKKLYSETLDGAIKIGKHTPKSRKDRRNRFHSGPKPSQWYCQFVLYKQCHDTIEAINTICRIMKLRIYCSTYERLLSNVGDGFTNQLSLYRANSKLMSYAGTKDLRAVTTQRVRGSKITAERLAGLNKRFKGITLGNFEYVDAPLKLGDLRGNRFDIILRHVQISSEDLLSDILASLKNHGFINYFGMQRFGTSSIPTHRIGCALLQNNWKAAVELIMKPRDGEHEDVRKARERWIVNQDANEAYALFPKRCVAERQILNKFAQTGDLRDYVGALNAIPRNLRLMYVHAYQSYIWNCVASERRRLYGCDGPVVGDLVLVDDEVTGDVIDTDDIVNDASTETEGDVVMYKEPNVVIVNEQNICNFTIDDVVLPLPGHLIIYPENALGEKYVELMGKDKLDANNMTRSVRDYSLPGSYRKFLGKPQDLTWTTFRYNDPNIALILTDLDKLEDKPEPTSIPNGKYVALKLSFNLLTSQYATMALREMLKKDTSAMSQHKLQIEQTA